MSHLKFFTYPGKGEEQQKKYWYSQAVRVGDGRIECAGQGGWDPQTGKIPDDLTAEIEQAFSNVELALKNAGGKGWSQVYSVKSYHVPMKGEALGTMVQCLKKYMPDHQPIWTTMGVQALGEEGMRVEIEVVAHDPGSGTST